MTDDYFTDLLSYSLDRLQQEPQLLQQESDIAKNQLQSYIFQNYQSLLSQFDNHQKLQLESQKLSQLLVDIKDQGHHQLSSRLQHYQEETQKLCQLQKQDYQLEKSELQVKELLNIPYLVESYLQQGKYDEASSCQQLLNKVQLLSGDSVILQKLSSQVSKQMDAFTIILIGQLYGTLTIGQSLKTISFIRLRSKFSENDLKSLFLEGRASYVSRAVHLIDKGDSLAYIRKLTEIYRSHIFDVITQYRALFEGTPSNLHEIQENENQFPLHSWSMQIINFYIVQVQEALTRVESGYLLSIIIDLCMHCAMSLGRVGLDFRFLLIPIFMNSVEMLIKDKLQVALQTFEEALDQSRWFMVSNISIKRQAQGQEKTFEQVQEEEKLQHGIINPPKSLMDYQPLAVLVNLVLQCFNEIRHCAIEASQVLLAQEIQKLLENSAEAIYYLYISKKFQGNELEIFEYACKEFDDTLCPFLLKALNYVFPNSQQLVDLTNTKEKIKELFEEELVKKMN